MTDPGGLACENIERLGEQLRKDVLAVDQMLAELEAEGVVERSRVEELASVLHRLAESEDESLSTAGSGDLDELRRLREILDALGSRHLDLCLSDRLLELYSGIRVRLMAALNAIEMAAATMKCYAEAQAGQKAAPQMKLQSSTCTPESKGGLGTSAIIRSQELERQRIAREIHDGPAQAIANVVLRMDILAKIHEKDPSRVPQEIARMKEIAQGALDEIRGFIFDLRPMTLQDLGLVATIKRVVSSMRELSKIDTRFVVEGEERPLGQLASLAVFRIAQEALNNIRKHSGASLAWVHLKYMKDAVVLVVEDNGMGFDPSELPASQKRYTSFGLLGMKERADDINGRLEITSARGQGTKVVLFVPTESNPALVD